VVFHPIPPLLTIATGQEKVQIMHPVPAESFVERFPPKTHGVPPVKPLMSCSNLYGVDRPFQVT